MRRRDYKNGTWSVWTGPDRQHLTFVGSYSGVADAMMEAVEQRDLKPVVVVTDYLPPEDDLNPFHGDSLDVLVLLDPDLLP